MSAMPGIVNPEIRAVLRDLWASGGPNHPVASRRETHVTHEANDARSAGFLASLTTHRRGAPVSDHGVGSADPRLPMQTLLRRAAS
jgi:hypothetical protein